MSVAGAATKKARDRSRAFVRRIALRGGFQPPGIGIAAAGTVGSRSSSRR